MSLEGTSCHPLPARRVSPRAPLTWDSTTHCRIIHLLSAGPHHPQCQGYIAIAFSPAREGAEGAREEVREGKPGLVTVQVTSTVAGSSFEGTWCHSPHVPSEAHCEKIMCNPQSHTPNSPLHLPRAPLPPYGFRIAQSLRTSSGGFLTT